MAVGFGMDSAAEQGPAVAVVAFGVVAVVEQAVQAVQVVVNDCLMCWGERLVLDHCPPSLQPSSASVWWEPRNAEQVVNRFL